MIEPKPVFDTKVREPIRTSESGIHYQTLKAGRLVRVGVLTMQTDADTQLDLSSPLRTVAASQVGSEGEVRKDDRFGVVLWRFVRISKSPNKNIKGRGVWIGWTPDEKGKFNVPLMHPDSNKENPTFGL